jgi:hypothetical protein
VIEQCAAPRRSHRPLVVAVLLAALLGLAELPFAAFMADDFIQLGELEGVSPCTWLGPLQLYTISDGVPEHVRAMQDAGAFPWFFGTDFKMAFFRPLSSALLAVDHAVWGLWPVGYRLQGACWFIALVASLGLVLRRALPGPIGTLALIVFTISGIHASLFWNATRHIVIAGALGMIALAAHVHWRETGWRSGRILSVVGFALSLTASEAALGIMAYLFAYEACSAPGDGKERSRAVGPELVLLAAYLAMYLLTGLGAAGGGGYADPLKAPVAFLVQLPARWLFLVGALIGGGGADLWILRPDLRWALTLLGGALVLAVALLLRAVWASASEEDRRGSRWLIAGAAAAAVPFVGTPIGSRCLVLPMLGGSVAIAFVLQRGWKALRHRPGVGHKVVSAGCVLLAVIHLGIAPIARLASPYVMREVLHERLVTAMQQVELDPERLARQRVVVLRAPDFIVGLHPFFFRTLYRLPMPRSWRTLSWAPYPHRFTHTAAETLELALVDGQLEAPSLAVGDVVELDGMRATVLARGSRGPSRVEFAFDRPLDDPGLYFLTWRAGRLQHVVLPAIGQEISL